MVIGLERGADLHMAQLMPLPLTVSCFSKIQIGFAFLVLAHPGSPGQRAVKRVCVSMLHPDLGGSSYEFVIFRFIGVCAFAVLFFFSAAVCYRCAIGWKKCL